MLTANKIILKHPQKSVRLDFKFGKLMIPPTSDGAERQVNFKFEKSLFS